jgi:hypothetical protein
MKENEIKSLESQNGLVGYFDILGYQAFLENNTPEEAAKKVINSLLKLDEKLPRKIIDRFSGEFQKDVEVLVKRIRWLVFSDTILITFDLTNETNPGELLLCWQIFLYLSNHLWLEMFEFGLPLRGIITKGSFFVEKTCFAGNSIVQAYKLVCDLNLAAVVITPEAKEWSETAIPENQTEGVFHCPYLVPFKSKGETKLNVLILSDAIMTSKNSWDGDLRQVVHDCFWRHEKDIGAGVAEKIENTEKLLRFFKYKFPKMFSKSQS